MKISILTVFPDLYNCFLQTSLVRRAQEADLIKIQTHGFMSFVPPKQRIDSPTFGPSAGMLIRPDVVETVQRVLHARSIVKSAGGNVKNPAVFRANIFENQLVIDGLLVYQKLGELATFNGWRGTGCGHKSNWVCSTWNGFSYAALNDTACV